MPPPPTPRSPSNPTSPRQQLYVAAMLAAMLAVGLLAFGKVAWRGWPGAYARQVAALAPRALASEPALALPLHAAPPGIVTFSLSLMRTSAAAPQVAAAFEPVRHGALGGPRIVRADDPHYRRPLHRDLIAEAAMTRWSVGRGPQASPPHASPPEASPSLASPLASDPPRVAPVRVAMMSDDGTLPDEPTYTAPPLSMPPDLMSLQPTLPVPGSPPDAAQMPAADQPPTVTESPAMPDDNEPPHGRMLNTQVEDLPPPQQHRYVPAEGLPAGVPAPGDVPTGVSRAATYQPLASQPAYQPPAPPPLLSQTAEFPAQEPGTAASAGDPVATQVDGGLTTLAAGASYRTRYGNGAFARLDEEMVSVEATFSPDGDGRVTVSAIPTFLTGGKGGASVTDVQRFGASALFLSGNRTSGVAIPGQSANGVGLDLGYKVDDLKADIGTSPLGFQEQNVVGGFEWAPALSDTVRLRLTAERRAVDDSLLSYAGAKDATTGQEWGGVTHSRGHADLQFAFGKLDMHVGGGGGYLDGHNVASNSEFEAAAGGSYPLYQGTGEELRAGLDLVDFGYAKNLRYFTLGQGGYFSPQQYFSALVPLTFRQQVTPDLSYEVAGSAGFQSYHESGSPYFPGFAGEQSLLELQTAAQASAVKSSYTADNRSGFAGGAHGQVDFRATPSLLVGAKADFLHAGNFDDFAASIFAKYTFGGAATDR